MVELSKQQQKNWATAEKNVKEAWDRWNTAYAQAQKDGSVVLETDSPMRILWDELQAARTKRNSLLNRYRSLGISI